jgi:hypothetical protein
MVMNRTRMAIAIAALAVLFCSASASATEDYQIEILPTIVVGQSYDDNIFLTRNNKQSDWITTVSPGLILHVDSAKTRLGIEYFPTFVWYNDLSENNTVRHSAKLDLTHLFTKRLQLDLKENYTKTEDPFLEALDPNLRSQSVRTTRNPYQRNEASANLQYQFDRHDTVSAGFRHGLLKNDDPTLDDITYYGPTASLTHWFDVRNGVELTYRYEIYDYDRESGTPSRDDLTGHIGGARYLYQFNTRTKGFVGYTFTSRNFDGTRRSDYQVHEGRVGIEHQFERDWKLTLAAGGYDPTSGADSNSGALFSARVDKQMKLGKFSVGFESGWDEGLTEVETRGFTRFYGVSAKGEYQFLQKLFGALDLLYRQNDRQQDISPGFSGDYSTLYGVAALKYELYKRIFLGLEYSYLESNGDDDASDYRDNRVLLTLSASLALLSPDRGGGRKPLEPAGQ